jgi:nucleotide-binding universal stress UspA family protein
MTSTHPPASGNIIVGVDGSASSEHAVLWASEEAHLQHRGLTLVHAQHNISANELASLAAAGIPPGRINEQLRLETDKIVERSHSLAAGRCPEVPIETVVGIKDPRRILLDLGSTASMTVVGTRGHAGLAGLLLGSVSGALVRHAETPVVVVRPRPTPGQGVLIGADASEESRELVERAFREASLRQLPLTVVHCVWDGLMSQARWTTVSESDPEAEDARLQIAESVAGMGEKFPEVDVSVKVTRGAIDACLVDLSAQYDLLAIGRPVLPLLLRLTLSSLTTPVAEHAHCPVLVVPPTGAWT